MKIGAIIGAFVVALLLLVGGWWFFLRGDSEPAPSEVTAESEMPAAPEAAGEDDAVSGFPSEGVEGGELSLIRREESKKIPEREKMVLSLDYDEGRTLSEIGEVLGVTESRVSQIHTKSILHLRSRMTAAGLT